MIPKYRVWDKDKKRMLYPCYDLIIEFHTMPDGKPYQCVFYGLEKVENFEIMMSLGVPDRNGKEIYSYDKISYSQRKNGTIQYNQSESRFEVFWSHSEIWKLNEHWLKTECEVTGNVFENPELLAEAI